MKRSLALLSIACLILRFDPASAQAPTDDAIVSVAERAETLSALRTALTENYVFPQRVPEIMDKLTQAAVEQRYENVDKAELTRLLTEDLISATGDLHFSMGVEEPGEIGASEFDHLSDATTNYGFEAVRLMSGNIGYLRFDNFSQPDATQATATAALKLLENVDGLIIDLRYNNGGYNDLGQFIASHLFSGETDQILASYYYNENGTRVERGQWVLSGVPGRRRPDMPVHILTSTVTFSAAEWMAFSLQKTGRATVIGAQTAGGGHPIERFSIGQDLFVQIPIGEIKGPKGGEFEGVGVSPDVQVPSYQALSASHLMMLEGLAAKQASAARDWALMEARARIASIDIDDDWLQSAAGHYADRELILGQDGLSYQWRDRFILKLTPLSKRIFAVEGTNDYRIELVGEGSEITGIARVFLSGERQTFKRTR